MGVIPQKVWVIIFCRAYKVALDTRLICFSTFLYQHIEFFTFLEVARRGTIALSPSPKPATAHTYSHIQILCVCIHIHTDHDLCFVFANYNNTMQYSCVL